MKNNKRLTKDLTSARALLEKVSAKRVATADEIAKLRASVKERRENVGQHIVDGGDPQEIVDALGADERKLSALEHGLLELQKREDLAAGAVSSLGYELATYKTQQAFTKRKKDTWKRISAVIDELRKMNSELRADADTIAAEFSVARAERSKTHGMSRTGHGYSEERALRNIGVTLADKANQLAYLEKSLNA